MIMGSSTCLFLIGGELIYIQLKNNNKCMADDQFYQANNKQKKTKRKQTKQNKQTKTTKLQT